MCVVHPNLVPFESGRGDLMVRACRCTTGPGPSGAWRARGARWMARSRARNPATHILNLVIVRSTYSFDDLRATTVHRTGRHSIPAHTRPGSLRRLTRLPSNSCLPVSVSHACRLSPIEYRFLVDVDAHHSEVIVIRIACVAARKRALLGTGAILEDLLLCIQIIWHNA